MHLFVIKMDQRRKLEISTTNSLILCSKIASTTALNYSKNSP